MNGLHNMGYTEKSKWIWIDEANKRDTYGEFYDELYYESGRVVIRLSCDSNYSLYINGRFADSGQYADYPHYKVYDEFDITPYMNIGRNSIAIVVWYYGKETFMCYYPGNAALRYEVTADGNMVCQSDESTLSRKSITYRNGYEKIITGQLGYSFLYDATKYDGWMTEEKRDFVPSRIVEQELPLYKRAVEKLEIGNRAEAELIKRDKNYYLFDLGKEEVGFFTLKVKSKTKQKLTIAYGEHINDGCVRRIVGKRDFSVEVIVGEGETEYTNYFRRLGLRYFEIHSENEIEIEYASILPVFYPLTKKEKHFINPLHQWIYDVSVRTLELCMHEHYEDCPWREQCMYAMDSRNQMLCGYYAFGEYIFPRESLKLMSKDDREDGLLAICTPTAEDKVIPSFSLFYFIQVYEYTMYSGDLTLAKEVMPKMESIIETFLNRMENGLVPKFTKSTQWNFYEWADGLEGDHGKESPKTNDCALNCLISIALQYLHKTCGLLGVESSYNETALRLNEKIRATFYNEETGLLLNSVEKGGYSELVNSLAVVCGVVADKEAERLCEILATDNDLTKISLSMLCFKFDALLKVNEEKYKDCVIKTIEEKYKHMLDCGATSFWETELGEKDFDNAGSLCHGWSAMPVYYLSKYAE